MTETSEMVQYAAAWKDRKRRFLTYVVALNSFWVIVLPGFLSQADPRFDLSGRTLLMEIAAWFVAQTAAGVWLNRFRCPRCGNLFYFTWKMERAKNRRACRHCGLVQDSRPT